MRRPAMSLCMPVTYPLELDRCVCVCLCGCACVHVCRVYVCVCAVDQHSTPWPCLRHKPQSLIVCVCVCVCVCVISCACGSVELTHLIYTLDFVQGHLNLAKRSNIHAAGTVLGGRIGLTPAGISEGARSTSRGARMLSKIICRLRE